MSAAVVAAGIFTILAFTGPLHGLIRARIWLVEGTPFAVLWYDPGPAMVLRLTSFRRKTLATISFS